MVGIGVPICVQCRNPGNPCRCKVVGPTVGFLAFGAAAMWSGRVFPAKRGKIHEHGGLATLQV
ncbi:hypothetical protein Ahy_B01g053400 [Arachis hypogaea]|uniref:Uncharacterized protein n=1 Tax=Arachis hypogaea TaxID=3818 RepID=A0A445ARN1_ARAHY|nr:hypothetical protein Ahy_B01g053400 [Arachis hypogaea]